MTLQYATILRNAQLNAIETTVGTAPILRIYDLSAAAPADCGVATVTGGTLAEITCPSDWLNAASGGSVTLNGTWSDSSANAAGTADFFRLYDSGGGTCMMQGTINQGSGDLSLDNIVIAASQVVTINTFTITAGNA